MKEIVRTVITKTGIHQLSSSKGWVILPPEKQQPPEFGMMFYKESGFVRSKIVNYDRRWLSLDLSHGMMAKLSNFILDDNNNFRNLEPGEFELFYNNLIGGGFFF